ncbi:MAG: DEAD/DEAH box helicase family protein [Candidatus Lokiarchaeota archaeon]|nr:DEAD/DEAH box helicase family protein [Candidatus Lokiarchaeota archaeon]
MSDTDTFLDLPFIKSNLVKQRDYQTNIFASCIGKNSLVVLPTGMGKTIIALMLALYTHSQVPDKKILFLAPTKPLVAQHQQSFIEMSTLEEWQLPMLTVPPTKRETLYLDASIAFLTPQILQNDIINKKIDLKEVSLIIFDEAHRAVGDYAYTFIAKMYHQEYPHGLILGMSASPGGDEEKIQEVCENLYISNVEIRSETSPDVAPYVQDVQMNWIPIQLPNEYLQPKKILESMLKIFQKELYNSNFLDHYSLNKISRKDLLASSRRIDFKIRDTSASSEELTNAFYLKKVVSNSIRVSHMLELLEAQGIDPLYKYHQKCIAELKTPKASKSLHELMQSTEYRKAMQLVRSLVESDFVHPKLIKIRDLLNQQFQQNPDSRVLIFANFRDTVDSIVEFINNTESIIAEKFIGQQARKKGRKIEKGMTQKEQIAKLDLFRAGDINTLVATSVAEEGLDIAECDLVIFYDVIPSEIRTIQRRGRTGRQSEGKLYILMAKGTREEGYYYTEKKREKRMKHVLANYNNSHTSTSGQNGVKKSTKKQKMGNILDFMHESEENSIKDAEILLSVTEQSNSSPSSDSQSKRQVIIADTRETQSPVVRELAVKGMDVILKTLNVADYILSEQVGVERKTDSDFVESLKDGRLFDELHHLSQSFHIPILILEGNPVNQFSISKTAILGALASIIVNMRISVLYTQSATETADLLIALEKKIHQEKTPIGKVYTKKTTSEAEAQEQIISGIPGINIYRAQELLTAFSTLENIFTAAEDELEQVPGIGKKTAKKIREIAEYDYNKEKK